MKMYFVIMIWYASGVFKEYYVYCRGEEEEVRKYCVHLSKSSRVSSVAYKKISRDLFIEKVDGE